MDLLTLDQLGLVPTEPQADPGILSYANSQLSSGIDPDTAMQSTMAKYGEGQPFSFSYDPTSKQFRDNATPTEVTPNSGDLIPLDNLDFSTPQVNPIVQGQKAQIESNKANIDSQLAQEQQTYHTVGGYLSNALDTAGQDIQSAYLAGKGALSNWNQTHATTGEQILSPADIQSAQVMGITNPSMLEKTINAIKSAFYIPVAGVYKDKEGNSTVGTITKLTPNQLDKVSEDYVSKNGGDLASVKARIASTFDPNSTTFDPIAVAVADNPIIENLVNPAAIRAKMFYNIKAMTAARNVIANPSQYTPGQISQAKNFITQNTASKESIPDQIKDFAKQGVDNPIGTAKQLLASIAQNPALLTVGDLKLGDMALGSKAARTAQVASTADKLAATGAEAAPNASEFAQSMGATATRRAQQYADIAQRAKTAGRALSASQRVLDTAGAASAGAAINVGSTEAQELQQQGFVRPGSLISPAAIGAIAGGGLSLLHGDSSLGDNGVEKAPVEAEGSGAPQGPEAAGGEAAESPESGNTNNPYFPNIPESSPGHPLASGNVPIDDSHTVPLTGGVHSSGTYTHIDKDFPETVTVPNRSGTQVDIPAKQIVANVHEVEEGKLMHPVSPIGQPGIYSLRQKMGNFYTPSLLTKDISDRIRSGLPLTYPEAHNIATAIENNYVSKTYNVDPKVYQDSLKPYIKAIAERAKEEPQSTRPPGIDTKPYDDSGLSEQVAGQGVSGGPTGNTGSTKVAGFISKNKGKLIPLAVATATGSLAASTLNNPNDSTETKLGRAAVGSLAGLLGGMDMFGRPLDRDTEAATFAGRRADTYTIKTEAASNEATKLHFISQYRENGLSPEQIHEKTGIYVDPEGNPMHEVTDHNMEFARPLEPLTKDLAYRNVPLNEVIKDSGFQKAYPELAKKITVRTDNSTIGKLGGYYDPKENLIGLNPQTPERWQSTILHELQHAVQSYEGWPQGSSSKWFQEIIDNPQARNTMFGSEYKGQKPSDLYHNTYGEELARETADRQHYTDIDRREIPPLMLTPKGDRVIVHGSMAHFASEEPSISEHLAKTGEMDEDGKLRGMVLGEDKVPDEPTIIQKAKQGDQRAIASLYKQYMPRLTTTLNTMLRGKLGSTLGLEGEDIAHIAFTNAIKALPNFRGDSSFYTYLYSIARNAAFQALDKSKRTLSTTPLEKSIEDTTPVTKALTGKDEELLQKDHPMGPRPTVENVPDTEGTPEEHAIAQQTSNMLNHVLSKLPEDIRNTVKLVEMVGMSYEEAAQALGVPVGTIRSRLHNAQKVIEQSLQKGHGAQFRKQGGFATPEALQKLLKTGLLLGAGAYVGSQLSNPDHKLRGSIYGGLGLLAAGEISPKGMYQSVKTALSPSDRINVKYLLNDWDTRRASMDLLVSRIQYKIDKLAPSKESQRKITYWLDGQKGVSLTPRERQAALVAKSFYDKVLGEGLDTGVLKDFLSNYVNHEWVNPKMAEKFQQEIENSFPTNMSPKDRHALARTFLTLEKGKAAGLIPKTENVNDLIAIYGRSMARAMANKALLEGLKSHVLNVQNGIKAAMPATKAPYNFVAINHPQLAGVRVSPDIAPSLRFLFHQTGGGVISALEGLNIALKREETGLSLFHPYALSMAFLTANPFTKLLGNLGEMGKSFVGKSKAHQVLLNDGTDLEGFIQGGVKNGLKLTLRKGQVSDEDINTGFYKGLSQVQNFLEKTFPAGGKVGQGIKNLYGLSDKLVWENVHTGLKATTFMNAYERMLRNNQDAVAAGKLKAMPTKDDLYRQAASYTNDIFGGLNWRRLADDATTRVGRLAALAVSTPLARRIGQVMLFAPDWTYSTIRSFVKAFGEGSGFSGVLKPKTLADLHRQYILRNAVIYFTLYNGINQALSGHPIWKNKDPLTVDMGHGERLQINKHFMEVPHAVANPGKFALGKLGTIPSEALEQALKVDYLNPDHMPPMKNRFAHLVARTEPFFVQTLEKEGPQAAMLGLAGAPVYGGHRELDPEELQEKKQAKRDAARKASKTREHNRMEKMMRGQF